jgi:hypothetical protein
MAQVSEAAATPPAVQSPERREASAWVVIMTKFGPGLAAARRPIPATTAKWVA